MWKRQSCVRIEVAAVALALVVGISPVGVTSAGAAEEPPFTVTILPGQPVVFDGQPAVFRAVTDPPGHEHLVEWSAVTRWGLVQPESGQGETFITVFFDTFADPLNEECQWLVVRAGDPEWREFAEWKQFTEPDCIPDIAVPAGDDCMATDPCNAVSSFCKDPLPQDFFGSGSKQWRGEIYFKGDESEEDDTLVGRLESMTFTGLDIRTIRIELKKLKLESCDNIVVEFDDETEKEFSVKVDESEFGSEEGEMRVERLDDFGGEFESSFPVAVKYTFTDVDDPDNEIVLDTGDPESSIEPVLMRTVGRIPWVSQLQPGIGVQQCGLNFAPGVRSQGNGGGGRQCCRVVESHANPGGKHKHPVKWECETCPDGACYDKKKLKCKQVLPEFCNGADEVFMGPGTSCQDNDGDGLPNFAEKDDCCKADLVEQDVCNALSSPFDVDTDGDGTFDGDELLQGTDPCTPDP